MSVEQVRIDLLKILIPTASRVGITEPANVIEICRKLEEYVLEFDQTGVMTPDTPGKRGPGRPRKEKPDQSTPAFLTPPNGGQVEPSPR